MRDREAIERDVWCAVCYGDLDKRADLTIELLLDIRDLLTPPEGWHDEPLGKVKESDVR